MRRYYFKVMALLALGAALPAFFLKCDRVALNLQRGFWEGLGESISDLLTDPLASCVG